VAESNPAANLSAPPSAMTGTRGVAQIGRIQRIGLRRHPVGDLYHQLLSLSWPKLLGIIVCLYLAVNAVFGLLYLAGGDCLENARPGSFSDTFFFSVQTLGTIGYGKMVPRTLYANILVTTEVLTGLLGFALATGLFFTKFARPTARVLFSKVMVVSPRDGIPHLMFRMANERSNQIVEAQLRFAMLRNERTAEGENLRRFYELPLVRNSSPMFALTWTALHAIDANSPLRGQTAESLKASNVEFVVSLIGTDDTFSQTVHARHNYHADDIVWGSRLADVFVTTPDGTPIVDYRQFHTTVPVNSPS
jgi:inward rectifier potassium channel